MKKSIEIVDLPVISITEGRELGTSKSLLIDAKNGAIAAITIEDEDWYRGVKLLPYSSVVAIGQDAVTVINSENILTLEDAGDYEAMLDANIKIIGTKAITKTGIIQGNVVEIYVGDGGKIEKCEIESPDGALSEITASQVSIFGKQVTVIDADVEATLPPVSEAPAPVAAAEPEATPESVEEESAEAEVIEEIETETEDEEYEEIEVDAEDETEEFEEIEEEAEDEAEYEEIEVEEDEEYEEVEVEAEDEEEIEEPEAETEEIAEAAPAADQAQQVADQATLDRHRRFLLGKTATRTITMNNGVEIVAEGDQITEEVLQKAKLANKLVELTMNIR